MGGDPYHCAGSSDCHHLCRGWNHLHCHTARQIKVGVVIVTLLGRSRWVWSLSQCSADEGGCGHCRNVRQMKVGVVIVTLLGR